AIIREYTDISVYNNDLDKVGLYNQRHFSAEMKLNKLIVSNLSAGVGTRFDYLRYGPEIKTFPRAKGKINFLTSFVDLHFNNLDRPAYPNAGNVFGIEAGINYNQHPDYTYSDGVSEEVHDFPDFDKKTYYPIKYNSAHYLPINRHSIFLKVQIGRAHV